MAVLRFNELRCEKQEDYFGKDDVVIYVRDADGRVEAFGPYRIGSGSKVDLDGEVEFDDQVEVEVLEKDTTDPDDQLGIRVVDASPVGHAEARVAGPGHTYYLNYSVLPSQPDDDEGSEAEEAKSSANGRPSAAPAAQEPPRNYESGYFYDEPGRKFPMYFEVGLHGLDAQAIEFEPQFYAKDKNGEYAEPGRRVDPLYVPDGEKITSTGPSSCARQNLASPACNSLSNRGIVEFISFGKSHRYLVEDYKVVAPHWRDMLFLEARILVRSIHMDMSIAAEFIEPDGSVPGWLTHGLNDIWRALIGRWFSDTEKIPDPYKDYDPLMKRAADTWKKVKACSSDDYGALHSAGVEFERIRWQLGQLNARMERRLKELVTTAEWGEKISTETEGVAFTVLDLYGQVRFANSPAGLAAYRVGVLSVRAGARYMGARTAEMSQQSSVKQLGKVVRSEAPKILTDLFLGTVKRGFSNPAQLTPGEEFANQLLSVMTFSFFETIDFYCFEAKELGLSDPRQKNEAFLDKFLPKLGVEVFNGVVAVIVARIPDEQKKKWLVGKIVTGVTTVVASLVREFTQFSDTAKSENRPLLDIVLADLGWCIVRIAKDMALAYAKEPTQEWMQKQIRFEDKFFRELFLSIRLRYASADVVEKKKDPIVAIGEPPPPPPQRGPSPQDGVSVGATKTPPMVVQSADGHESPQRGQEASKNPTAGERRESPVTEAQLPRQKLPEASLSNKDRKRKRLALKAAKLRAKARAKAKAKETAAAGDVEPPDDDTADAPPPADDSTGGSAPPPAGGGGGGSSGGPPSGGPPGGPGGGDGEEERRRRARERLAALKREAAERAAADEEKRKARKADYHAGVARDSMDHERAAGKYVRSRPGRPVLLGNTDQVIRRELNISEKEKCCDIVAETREGIVYFADAKGATTLAQAIKQLENTAGHYQKRMGGEMNPVFFIIVPKGKVPVGDGGLHLRNGKVFSGASLFFLFGKPVTVVELDRT